MMMKLLMFFIILLRLNCNPEPGLSSVFICLICAAVLLPVLGSLGVIYFRHKYSNLKADVEPGLLMWHKVAIGVTVVLFVAGALGGIYFCQKYSKLKGVVNTLEHTVGDSAILKTDISQLQKKAQERLTRVTFITEHNTEQFDDEHCEEFLEISGTGRQDEKTLQSKTITINKGVSK
ncbi:hypothetical protein E1301_Tti013464 [Triplophysa tibetana]|uniref:Uncharacterized protein n=1 Tax=Triplophysa tibetana TaxID=1572043 RepID=A0A5A9NS80_9TELE|nr:hypothetical protein E1301_Tti013464 [Triplophysa tibetana]